MRSIEIEHRDGVSWVDAPVPRRLHRCWAQTRGWYDYLTLVERCPCGAIRIKRPFRRRSWWMERNSARRVST